MQCPRCNSSNVVINREYAGSSNTTNYMRTGVKSSWIIPAGVAENSSDARYRTVALCNNCGNTWTIGSQIKSKKSGCLTALIIVLSVIGIIFMFGISIWVRKETGSVSKSETSSDPTVITTNKDKPNATWDTEYTSIEEFKWTIDGDEIVLGTQKKKNSQVRLSDHYTVDGVEAHIVKLDATFVLRDIDSVIVPEGVTSISDNCFNSCGIRFLYLPSTLENFNGWSYFHDMVTIYYGGSEEQWNERFNTEYLEEGVKIVFNANPDDL